MCAGVKKQSTTPIVIFSRLALKQDHRLHGKALLLEFGLLTEDVSGEWEMAIL
jgi:hypothetical protein